MERRLVGKPNKRRLLGEKYPQLYRNNMGGREDARKEVEKKSKAIICLIYQKGDILFCKNCSGTTVLNTGYKVFSFLLN